MTNPNYGKGIRGNRSTPLANLRSNWVISDNPSLSSREDDEKPMDGAEVRLIAKFGPAYISPLFVIVENYGHKSFGRGKREYLANFTEAERKIISRWYGILYDYHLRTGIPINGVAMSLETLELLRRAANFFATI